MKIYLFLTVVLLGLYGCHFQRRTKYLECMESGAKSLYGKELASEFCNCMADGLIEGRAPFELGNNCSKPILKKMNL